MYQNPFSAGALPRTPQGELTTLPQTSSRLGRGYPHLIPLPAGRLDSVRRPPQHKILATPLVSRVCLYASVRTIIPSALAGNDRISTELAHHGPQVHVSLHPGQCAL